MARGLRLRDLEALVDIAHADLAGQQQSEDAQACAVAEGLEERRHGVQSR